ncbi:MAG TPA: tRNA preQ1(34) S-adenosylmethionine ribosyltransferase-isomerase QueA [Clostridiales bacterium]|nr:tRNA preQ1(34) S-adenosylmethionine ribosyltransferase-isomerase QueA [Clostridiales bacterium]
MKVKDFYYELPKELIAQEPLKERSSSRLMVLEKSTGGITHEIFNNIAGYLKQGDCLVINDTRVIPARLLGEKEDTGGKIEFVLLKKERDDIWEVILKPGRRARPGSRFVFGDGILKAEIIDILDEGNRLVKFEFEGIFEQVLDKVGIVPLPPYITKKLSDSERYQTVYSKYRGSAAAPTAGLHFTNELIDSIKLMGVEVANITLHIGLGTFRPVKVDNVEEHHMHSEYYKIDQETCNKINAAKKSGGRIIAVGTTSCRVLETASGQDGLLKSGEGYTDIFIYPGYKFKMIGGLITNFHLPESTLIMLVSAFAGYDNVMEAYKTAVNERYRFFSFGDAMFII